MELSSVQVLTMPRRGREDIRTQRVRASPTAALQMEDPFGIGILCSPYDLRLSRRSRISATSHPLFIPVAVPGRTSRLRPPGKKQEIRYNLTYLIFHS
jgi:hypothetical protein